MILLYEQLHCTTSFNSAPLIISLFCHNPFDTRMKELQFMEVIGDEERDVWIGNKHIILCPCCEQVYSP